MNSLSSRCNIRRCLGLVVTLGLLATAYVTVQHGVDLPLLLLAGLALGVVGLAGARSAVMHGPSTRCAR